MPLTSVGKDFTLNVIYGANEAVPTNFYMRAHTAAPPTDGTNGSELAVSGYAPATVANNATNFPVSNANLKRNGTVFLFGTNNSGADVVITHLSIAKTNNAGVILRVLACPSPITIHPGETIRIDTNKVSISM